MDQELGEIDSSNCGELDAQVVITIVDLGERATIDRVAEAGRVLN